MMPRSATKRIATGVFTLLLVISAFGCHTGPSEPAPVSGAFTLTRWNDIPLPVNLGFDPPDTCARSVTSGSMTLDVTHHTYLISVRIVNCHGADAGSTDDQGTFTQNGTTLDFTIEGGGSSPRAHFYGSVVSGRVVVTNGSTLEFIKS